MAAPATFFPDNTVLVSLGYIDRIDLIELLFHERHWCLTVSRECFQFYAINGFTTWDQVRATFGQPLEPTPAERVNSLLLRDNLASPHEAPTKHLGEAETIAIARSRGFTTPVFLTDDQTATDLAQRKGVSTFSTWNILKAAFRHQHLTDIETFNHAVTLRDNDRGWPKGVGPTYNDFVAWLNT